MSPAGLLAALRREGVTVADDSPLTRAMYSSDASLYRVVPQVVARPRSTDELLACLAVARAEGAPLTMRGAGTSIAGNAVGPGLVVDTARHLGRVLSLDPEARTAVVQPGAVHATLQAEALAHGLRFGPDPSTHTRCTIGGMVGNNACGSRALGYGRTSDNVAALRVAFGNGEVTTTDTPGPTADRLAALADAHLAHVRPRFGRFSRQVSGYALEHLLPEQGRRLDRFLAGSEGTLAVVLEATVALVPDEPVRRLVLLGYPSMAEAADAVPALLDVGPLVACEGLDSRLVDTVRRTGAAVPDLPRGDGFLFVETAGEDAVGLAARVVEASGALDHRTVTDPREAAALWRIREDGAGLAARSLDRPAYSGWEDSAVPPQHLGAWLRDLDALLAAHDLHTLPYGHFGDGCVHARIDFTFDAAGRRHFREFLTEAAVAVRAYGGSLSGEHGDGRARSELLPLMYDEESLRLFGEAKRICDPDGLLNPGVLVDPAPVDADLRPGRVPLTDPLAEGAHRCTGVGRCVAPTATGVMCPSWQATREEKDTTRGRARVLQEALDGSLVHGLADPAVGEALDLCLACKGCASDCPTGVDLAAYKSEVLHRTLAGRRRPRSHYTLGRLPEWVRRAPAWSGRLMGVPGVATVVRAVAGVDQRRSLPALASPREVPAASAAGEAPDVWLWLDTFTRAFRPGVARAAVDLLESAGQRVGVIDTDACCGLPLVTTGQLDRARRTLDGAVTALTAYAAGEVPVVGLEPSCLATLHDDAPRLVVGAEPLRRIRTLAAHLATLDWTPPDLTGVPVVAQPHCHHASVLGWSADEGLLRGAGAELTRVPGCCGLAGNFGMERGHYDVSVAVAETHLLPAVRRHPGAVVLADGLSCHHQLADLAGVPSVHLAELLAGRIPRPGGGFAS